MEKHYFLIILLLGIFLEVSGQLIISEESYFSHKFSTDDGLSQSNVNCIIKDHEGFLWIGTDEGLNRFDSYEFKKFNTDPKDSSSIKDDKIRALFEDSKNQLWIGTNQGGLNLYDRKKQLFINYFHNPSDSLSLSNNSITTIYEDSYSRLWIGTLWGLNLFSPNSHDFRRFNIFQKGKLTPGNEIQGIGEKNGELWGATRGGLIKINLNDLTVNTVINNPNEFESNINSRMECLFIDSNEDIWIGTNGAGLAKYNDELNTYIQYSLKEDLQNNTSDIILSIIEDKPGELLIGTDGAGIFRFFTKTGTFSQIKSRNDPTLVNASAYGIFKDEGLFWLGVYGNGLVQFNQRNMGFEHLEYFSQSMKTIGRNSVLCLAEDLDNNIWIGTDGAGLYQYNPSTKRFKLFIHEPNNPNSISGNVIKSLLVDGSGNVYAGTYAAGLNYINTVTHKIERYVSVEKDPNTLPRDHVWALYQDSEKRIWVGLLGGFCEFFPATKSFYRFPTNALDPSTLGSTDINKIFEDKNKNLWVGTAEGGLGKFDKTTNTFKKYEYHENNLIGLSNNEIKDIIEDKNGKLWIATNGGGLNYYDDELDEFIWKKSESSLGNDILSIIEDNEDNFWIGTFHGLAKYNYKTDIVKYYTKGSGIQGNEFNYDSKLKGADGTFYFGGLNGLTMFKPKNIHPNLTIPKVALSGFYLFHEQLPLARERTLLKGDINVIDKIVLNPNQNVFSFKYVALDFSIPKKNKFAYRLEGFDKDWNYIQHQRIATYTNLPPGQYIFHVITSNNEGYWSEEGKRLTVIVEPFWYQRTWAHFLFLLIGILILIGIIRIRTGLLIRQKKILEVKVRYRTMQIEKQKKELEDQNFYIKEQNEELTNKNEEIQSQREQLEEKSVLLEQAHLEVKKSNDELKMSNLELEKIVDKRTSELRETISQLIKTDEELNTFLYRSSHDLRGPIVTLIGLSQLAKMEIKDEQYHFYFDKIRKSCFHMLQFLNKLNDSNVLFKSVKVNDKLNWAKIITDVKLELDKIDPENKVEKLLEINIEKTLYSDELMVKTIILNLMENSIIFSRRNDPFAKLTLTLENKELIISVLDNGVGIEPKIQDKIFNMFFRGSGLSQGNGLGLYLVQKAVEIVNGKISFTCIIRETTEFIVKIPITKSEQKSNDLHDEKILNFFEEKF